MNRAMSTSSSATTILFGSASSSTAASAPVVRLVDGGSRRLGLGPQLAHGGGRIGGAVDGGAGHERVGPRLGTRGDRVLGDPTVDLDAQLQMGALGVPLRGA